ncbi:RDD family protein [Chloroflexota bacterium]
MYDNKGAPQKFCPHCGATRPDGSTFCPNCGEQSTMISERGMVQDRVQYAGFWIRFVAWIIDVIIINIISSPLYLLPAGLQAGISWIISPVYSIAFWIKNDGRTPGKMAVKVKVVKANGDPIDFGTALLRWIGTILSALPLGLGFFWIAWDSQKQGWHDKIAGTYVITYES